MLILQITQDYFSHGAIMKRARQETKGLIEAGHKVVVITDLRSKSQFSDLRDYKNKILILPLKSCLLYGFRNISSQLTFTLKLYFALRKIETEMSIDLIVAHASILCYSVAPFANHRKIPAIWVIQDLIRDRIATGNPYNKIETLIYKHSNSYSLKNMPFLVAVSKYTGKLALIDGAKKNNLFVINNAVNIKNFKPKFSTDKTIDILFIGRLSIEKGVDILINSAQYFSKKRNMVIIGEGPLNGYLRKLSIQVIDQNIKFLGFINHEKLPEYIQKAKIVVTPSRSECHASVPIESMACGVPVIASRVAGMEDTISHKKNGWLLPSNDPKTLAEYIENALNNPSTLDKISKRAREKSKKFSEERFRKEIVAFYENLVNNYYKRSIE